jgi:hypothetical protein
MHAALETFLVMCAFSGGLLFVGSSVIVIFLAWAATLGWAKTRGRQ